MKSSLFLSFALFASVLLPMNAAMAQETATQTTYFAEIQERGIAFAYVDAECEETGECGLDDIMQVFVNISNFILGIVGSVVLVVFVWGGLLFLTSGGSTEKITQGKTAMRGSIIGLIIVFVAFSAINFLTGALRGGTPGQTNYCELVSPAEGGHAGQGWACLDTGSLDMSAYTCETGKCPGPAEVQCCIPK